MNGTGDVQSPAQREIAMEGSKASQFHLVGKKLRAEFEDTKDQPIPERWIDLIRRLDERAPQRLAGANCRASRMRNETFAKVHTCVERDG